MKKNLGRIILLFVGLFLGILVAEFLTIRLEKKGIIKIDRSFIDDNRIFSESMIYKRKPYSSNIFKVGKSQNYWGINKYGFRDGDYALNKPKNTFRIIVLGDSITAGGGVDASESFPKILESGLNKEGPDTTIYEVLNMGVNGYGPVSYLGLYQDLAYKFSPDLVIVGFYWANDPVDSISYKVQHKEIFLSSLPDKLIPYPINQFLKEKSALWLSIMQRYYGWVNRYKKDVVTEIFQGDQKQHALFDTHVELSSQVKEGWRISGESTRKLVNLANSRKTKVIILGLPSRSSVDEGEWKKIKAQGHNVNEKLYKDPTSYREFLSMCKSQSFECLDLYNTIKTNPRSESLFMEEDNHFNPDGNQLIADTLLKYLISNSYVNFEGRYESK